MKLPRLFETVPARRLGLIFLCLSLISGFTAIADDEPKTLRWLTSRSDGLRDAQLNNRPMLVRFGAEYCHWCKRLDEEIIKPGVQEALKEWTLVELDLERNPRDAQALRVDGIPALRVIASNGRVVASHDGYLNDEKLLEWLKKSFDQATTAPEETLFGSGPPTELELRKIVRQFSERDAALREAAVRRLTPFPVESAELVVEVLKKEKLGAQLTSIELLREWEAPIDQLDPWQPESMTPERFERIGDWLAKLSAKENTQRVISPEEWADIRAELKRMLSADPETVQSIRERLARYRQALLPEVVGLLTNTSDDAPRSRLLALRYRLVMTDETAVKSPGLVDRLAAVDARTRQDAVREVTEHATFKTEPLFLELFADPDPLVRELSLLGLRTAGGDEGQNSLVKLLDDPDPNVRAAVLKVFAEDPWSGLEERLATYLTTEHDTGLLVHAVRCFRKMKIRSPDALLPLLKHRDWQVRAELVDTFTGGWQRYPDERSKQLMMREDVQTAVTGCLDDDDAFVVGRAMLAYKDGATRKVVEKIITVPTRHPSLTPSAIQILKNSQQYKDEIKPAFQQFFASTDPTMRAAAIGGLGVIDPEGIQAELLVAMRDENVDVRLAGVKTLHAILNGIQNHDHPKSAENYGVMFESSGDDVEAITISSGRDSTVIEEDKPDDAAPQDMKEELDPDDQPKPDATPDASAKNDDEKPVDPPVQPKAVAPQNGRKAGSGGFLGLIKGLFGGNEVETPPMANPAAPETQQPYSVIALRRGKQRDQWLQKFAKGEKRPEWLTSMIPPLVNIFESQNASERIASLTPLVALGEYARVRPELMTLAQTGGPHGPQVVSVLEWLPFAERESLAQEFLDLPNSKQLVNAVLVVLSNRGDIRDTDLVWKLAQSGKLAVDQVSGTDQLLRKLYFGQDYYNISQTTPSQRKRVVDQLWQQLAQPPGWNHIIALAMMSQMQTEVNEELTGKIRDAARLMIDNEQLDQDLRADAFQIDLILADKTERQAKLMELLHSNDRRRQKMALRILLQIGHDLSMLPKSEISFSHHAVFFTGQSNGEPITPEPPEGVDADLARSFLEDEDPEMRAMAGYVLAVSGEQSGIEPLVRYWQTKARNDDDWSRLVYRAIAALDDSSRIPILMQIYKELDNWRVREFYWTIRVMTGPKILEVRQRIRKEHPNELR